MGNSSFISKRRLKDTAESFGAFLDETALDRFDAYARLLLEWNGKINLTAITDPDDIVTKHFVDSLSLFKFLDIPKESTVIDVGTGAGFPGAAILIARPDLRLTLLDGTGKKLNAVADILSRLGLDAEFLHSRAEDAGKMQKYREKFDFATARAVANLRELSEYCLPFVKIGGFFLSLKGAKGRDEIEGAKKAVSILGGDIIRAERFFLNDAGERTIIITQKIRQTPTKYPRPSAKIAKFSLE